MEYSHLPIKLLSCPSHISRFVSFVQSGSYRLGPQRVERRDIYSTSIKNHFEDTALCSLQILLLVPVKEYWNLSALVIWKKVAQVAGRQSKLLSDISALLYVARRQWQTVGTHPKRQRMVPKWTWCQPTEESCGSLCCYWCMCCFTGHRCLNFTIHIPHLVSDEMALLAFFRFTQYK